MPDHSLPAVTAATDERFGSLGLDFVNTRVLTRHGLVDALESFDSLREWLAVVRVPGVPDVLPVTLPGRRTLVSEAVRFRDDLVGAFEESAASGGIGPERLFALNRALGLADRSTSLASGPEGTRLVVRYASDHPAGVLAPIALAAAELLAEADLGRLRPCAAPSCPRWFYDTSKGGRRRWCSMATCGNRAKAARFRRRVG